MTTFKNFAISRVATAPSPPTTGLSLIVESGDGTIFPPAPFNATVWPIGEAPLSNNSEIVRVTDITTDTFTIIRQQESSNSRSIQVGDQIVATITAETTKDFRNLNKVVVTDPYVIERLDDIIICNKTGDMNVYFPAAIGSGRAIHVKNINTGLVTATPDGSDTMDGDSSEIIYNGESLKFVDYDFGLWVVI
jgi:hypothetical protein